MAAASETFRLTEEELRQDPDTVFSVLGKLGEGSYGSVFKALHRQSSVVVALKEVPVANDLEDIIKEINVMNGCDSPSIVRYYGSYFKNDHLWMFIEYCAAGSVADIMKVCRCVMKEEEIALICKSALEGLVYLHDRRKIHRDIKAGNILLNSKGVAKLADFGVAGQLTDSAAKRNTVIGTPFWMAPEIIQEVGYGVAADIWSLGITCIEMAEGRPPYSEIHPMRAIFMIPTRPPPTLESASQFNPEFNNFIARCLTKEPAKRPSATELLKVSIAVVGCHWLTGKDPFLVSVRNRSSLMEKVHSAMDLIAKGALERNASEEDEEEEKDDAEAEAGYVEGEQEVTVDADQTLTPSMNRVSTNWKPNLTAKKSTSAERKKKQLDVTSATIRHAVQSRSESVKPASEAAKPRSESVKPKSEAVKLRSESVNSESEARKLISNTIRPLPTTTPSFATAENSEEPSLESQFGTMVVHDDSSVDGDGLPKRTNDIKTTSNVAAPNAQAITVISAATTKNEETVPSDSPFVSSKAKAPMDGPESGYTKEPVYAREVPSPFGRASTPPPLPMPLPENLDLHDLNQVLHALDRNMEMEITMIRAKYERKRVPIVEAIHTRKGSKSNNK